MAKMKVLDWIAIALLLVGGINWGLLGLLNFNLVSWLLTTIGVPGYLNFVYIVVGAGAVWAVLSLYKNKGRFA